MSHKIEFTKPDKVNGKEYKKGDTLSVSASIYEKLQTSGSVKKLSKKEN